MRLVEDKTNRLANTKSLSFGHLMYLKLDIGILNISKNFRGFNLSPEIRILNYLKTGSDLSKNETAMVPGLYYESLINRFGNLVISPMKAPKFENLFFFFFSFFFVFCKKSGILLKSSDFSGVDHISSHNG